MKSAFEGKLVYRASSGPASRHRKTLSGKKQRREEKQEGRKEEEEEGEGEK